VTAIKPDLVIVPDNLRKSKRVFPVLSNLVINYTRRKAVVYPLCQQAVYKLVLGHRAVMLNDWEGNRRYGVAVATRHRLKWFIHLGI